MSGDPPLGRRHVRCSRRSGPRASGRVGELARELGLSLPAASKLTRELKTMGSSSGARTPTTAGALSSALSPRTAKRVRAWLERRSQPLEQALATLDTNERERS